MITSVMTPNNCRVARKSFIVECTNKMDLKFRLHTFICFKYKFRAKGEDEKLKIESNDHYNRTLLALVSLI